MQKWQIENSEKPEILEKLFQVSKSYSKFPYFRVFDFALLPKSKTRT